jgi:hypothetical protein
LQVVSSQAKLCRLFQVKPGSAGYFNSCQALQVVLNQVKPSSPDCFKLSQALQVVSSQAKLCSLKQHAELGLT